MKNRDIIILLGLTEVASQCIYNETMSEDDFRSFFDGCNLDKMELQLGKLEENVALEELKIMLKEYGDMIREEQGVISQ